MVEEQRRKGWLVVEQTDHSRLLKPHDRAIGHGGGAGHALRLPRQASFTKEVADPQNGDHGFFALFRDYRELDLALLNIKDGVGLVALQEDLAVLQVVRQSPSLVGFG